MRRYGRGERQPIVLGGLDEIGRRVYCRNSPGMPTRKKYALLASVKSHNDSLAGRAKERPVGLIERLAAGELPPPLLDLQLPVATLRQAGDRPAVRPLDAARAVDPLPICTRPARADQGQAHSMTVFEGAADATFAAYTRAGGDAAWWARSPDAALVGLRLTGPAGMFAR